MANTETLIVELDASTSKLDSKIKKTDDSFEKLDASVKKTDKSFVNFAADAKKLGASVIAVSAAIGIAVAEASSFARELSVASNRTGDTVERLQELAFASNTVGISLEKLGDIGKDTNEKIAEFLDTGGGGFKDFIEVMRLTDIEGRALARTFAEMSGTEVLQEMVTQMERAGVASGSMSFALEGMASDATDLIPLLKNNGQQVKALASGFRDLGVTLTALDVKKIKDVAVEFDKFSGSFAAESRMLVARYSDEIIKALNVTAFLGVKTIDSFNVIAAGWKGLIGVAQAALTDFVNGSDTLDEALANAAGESALALNELLGEDFYELGVSYGENIAAGMAAGMKSQQGGILDIVVTGGRDRSQWEELDSKRRIGVTKNFLQASSILADQFLEDNKGVRKALVVMNTAAGIMNAFATSSNIYEAYGHAAVVAATGIVQLASINSAGKGGGSVGSASSAPPAQENFQPETSSLELSDSTASGSRVFNISVPDGDEIGEAIANWLNKAQTEGRV
jgi:hypothetical protein